MDSWLLVLRRLAMGVFDRDGNCVIILLQSRSLFSEYYLLLLDAASFLLSLMILVVNGLLGAPSISVDVPLWNVSKLDYK